MFLLTDPKHLLTVHGAVLTGTKKEHCTKSGIPVNAGFFNQINVTTYASMCCCLLITHSPTAKDVYFSNANHIPAC